MINILKWMAPLSLGLALPLTACEKSEPIRSEIVTSGKTDCSTSEPTVCFPYLFDANDPYVHNEILAWFVIHSSWDNGMRNGGRPAPLSADPDTFNRFMSKLSASNANEMRSKALRNCYMVFDVEPETDLNTQEGYDACVEQIKSAAELGDETMMVLNATINPDFSIEGFASEILPIAENGNEVGLIMMIEVAEEMDEHDEFDWLKKAWLSGNSRAGSAILDYSKMRDQLEEKDAIEIFESVSTSIKGLPSENLRSIALVELINSLWDIGSLSSKTQIAILSGFKKNFPEFSDEINEELDTLKE